MTLIALLAILALIVSIAWLISYPGYEPALAVVTALSALIAVIVVQRKKRGLVKQQQKVSGSSVGVQAGRNVTIGRAEEK